MIVKPDLLSDDKPRTSNRSTKHTGQHMFDYNLHLETHVVVTFGFLQLYYSSLVQLLICANETLM